MLTITIERQFSAAHRIEGHPKCGRLHGHNYRALFEFTGPVVDPGYIADFADLKELVDQYVNLLDHRYIVSDSNVAAHDSYYDVAVERGDSYMPGIVASSAEYLAEWFFKWVKNSIFIDSPVELVSVTVYETPTSCAKVTHE